MKKNFLLKSLFLALIANLFVHSIYPGGMQSKHKKKPLELANLENLESLELANLENNVILLIFQYADPATLEKLKPVNQNFHSLVKPIIKQRIPQLKSIAKQIHSKNYEEFNNLDEFSKNLVRALYFKKYNQVFIDEETLEDIYNYFTNKINKAKTSNQLNFNGSKYKEKLFTVLSFISYILPNLQVLDLAHNELTSLPVNLNLPNLQVLYLNLNKLESLPKNFGQNLPNLQKLDLTYNKLTSLPENLYLPNLQKLNLWDNQLTSLPKNFGRNLPKLERLWLWYNKLNSKEEQRIRKMFPPNTNIMF